MPRPDRIQYEHAFYHVMNRGRARQKIFHEPEYYEDFLVTLEESHTRFDAVVHAYCLMGNHYHLLIETPRANLDRIMRHINGVYTQRYNRRKGTDGPLFRGRYKSILIDEDAYLLEVGRYIHRNPAEVKGANNDVLATHRWSSYPAYINKAPAPSWLVRERTYQMLAHKNRFAGYRDFVLQGNGVEADEFYSKGNTGCIFGDKYFRLSIQAEKEIQKVSGDLGSVLSERPEIAKIVEAVAAVFGTDTHTITCKRMGRPQPNLPRQMAMYCSQQLGDHSLKDIATYFSLTNAGSVSPAIQVIKSKLKAGQCAEELSQLEKRLGIIK